MKTYLLIVLVLLIVFFSCKKKEKLQESTWTVNGEMFTAVATTSIGKAASGLASNGMSNRFGISFYFSYLPTYGKWPIGDTALQAMQNPEYTYIGFYYNGNGYRLSEYQDGFLQAFIYEGKVGYKLESTWFISTQNHSDSILISGDFYEP